MKIVKLLKFTNENIELTSEERGVWDGVEFLLSEDTEPLTRLSEVKETVKGLHYFLSENVIKGEKKPLIKQYRTPGCSLFNLTFQKGDMERLLTVTPYAHKSMIPIILHANTPIVYYEKRYTKMLAKFFAKTKIRCGVEDCDPKDIVEEQYRWSKENDVYLSLQSVSHLNKMTDFKPFFPIMHIPHLIMAYKQAGLLTKAEIMDELQKAMRDFYENSNRGLYVMITDCLGLPEMVKAETNTMPTLIELGQGEAITVDELIEIIKSIDEDSTLIY